jgi:MerR family mercuric resistance operon transcriptional regulator
MEEAELRIGEVASRTGVSIDTLRYYENRRLLGRARRSSGGFRLFGNNAVECVLFIKQAQELGFSLVEIGELLATGGADECRKVRDLLRTKLGELDERMESMKKFRRVLARHLKKCEHELQEHGKEACCPVVAGTKRKPGA